MFESEQTATQAFAERAAGFDGEDADTCLPQLFGEPPGIPNSPAPRRRASFSPPAGVDTADAWQLVVTIEGKAGSQDEGLSVTAYSDQVMLHSGDTITR